MPIVTSCMHRINKLGFSVVLSVKLVPILAMFSFNRCSYDFFIKVASISKRSSQNT